MAAPSKLRFAVVALALVGGSVLASGCGSGSGQSGISELAGDVATLQRASAQKSKSEELQRLRAAIVHASVRKLGVTYGPFLGVRCRRANHVGCDRVGVDIVFEHAANSVVAVVAGRHLRLRTPGMHNAVRYRDWVGTFANAGIDNRNSPFAIDGGRPPRKWAGYPPVYVPIEFRVAYADGRHARALFAHVFLGPGWG
jgi:hypothetical protein